MKERIISLVPKEETTLIEKLEVAKDRYDIIGVLLEELGTDKSGWEPWETAVEQAYIEEINRLQN